MTERDTAALARSAAGAAVYPAILAVDPGSRSTGIALRVGRGVLEAVTVERAEGDEHDHEAACNYAREVVETAREITRRNRDRLNAEAKRRGVNPGGLRHAVETLVAPSARPVKGRQAAVAPRVLQYLPVASTVLGMTVGVWPRSILVAPLGQPGWDAVGREHAPSVLSSRTPSGWLPGGSDRSHQRSAWAIAGAAHVQDAPPLREQANRAAHHAATQTPSADPEVLVPILRASVAETGSWDLLTRLPALARTVVAASTRDRTAGDDAAQAVEAYLATSEEGDGHG